MLESDSDRIHREILLHCYEEASLSPDPSTQIGAVIVSPSGYMLDLTMSNNGFVKGWVTIEADFKRPRKYQLIEHAERSALYKAIKYNLMIDGYTLYSSWAGCADCCRAIVSCGIRKLVRHYPPEDSATDRWLESVSLGDEILKAAGVTIIDVHGPVPGACKILRDGQVFDPSKE